MQNQIQLQAFFAGYLEKTAEGIPGYPEPMTSTSEFDNVKPTYTSDVPAQPTSKEKKAPSSKAPTAKTAPPTSKTKTATKGKAVSRAGKAGRTAGQIAGEAAPIEGYLTRIAEYLRARPGRTGFGLGVAGTLAGGKLLKTLFGRSEPAESAEYA